VFKQLVACLGKNQYCLAQRKFDIDTWQAQKGEGFNLVNNITFSLELDYKKSFLLKDLAQLSIVHTHF
jgi:hypothetical protein